MKEFRLQELGENIESALVVKLMVKPGDMVAEDEPVLEIETDKATIEVPSSVSGKVLEVFAKEGEKMKVGSVVFTVAEESSAPTETPAPVPVAVPAAQETVKAEVPATPTPAPQTSAASEIVDFIMPELGENITSATVVKLLVKVGDVIQEDQNLLEIETDKATIEVPSTFSGTIVELFVTEGGKANVGAPVLKIKTTNATAAPITPQPVPQVPASEPAKVTPSAEKKSDAVIRPAISGEEAAIRLPAQVLANTQVPILQNAAPAAPSVRRLARELGVDIALVPGSGPGGRISLDDVKAYVKSLNEGRAQLPAAATVGVKQQPLPDFSKFGEIRKEPMSTLRTKAAEHLSYAWATIPHVTQFDKADITDLEEMRKKFAPVVQAAGGKLTMTSILVKVITSAMKVFPQFNASVDMEKKELIYKSYYNVGIAVDTDFGLIVPVIKGTDKKNLITISQDINTLSEKARNKKIGLDDLQGGSITISNLGGIGGTYFTPIVNSPEVAILGVSRGAMEPVYKNGNFVPRLMLPLSLSYDHRIIDGADAIRFLRWIIEALENPIKLIVEG